MERMHIEGTGKGLLRDANDILLVMALMTLPVDGTRFGVTMP